jgi:hypothetical protein
MMVVVVVVLAVVMIHIFRTSRHHTNSTLLQKFQNIKKSFESETRK